MECGQKGKIYDSSVEMLRETRKFTDKTIENAKSEKPIGQVKKSIRRMPWHWEPTKDVISCEKLR